MSEKMREKEDPTTTCSGRLVAAWSLASHYRDESPPLPPLPISNHLPPSPSMIEACT